MNKVYLQHSAILDAMRDMAQRALAAVRESHGGELPTVVTIYGVPRGGIPIAYMLAAYIRQHCSTCSAHVVFKADQASVIVDDLVDSGATRDRIKAAHPNTPFITLLSKREGDDTWFVFPWEVDADGKDESDADIFIRASQRYGITPEEAKQRLEFGGAAEFGGEPVRKPSDIIRARIHAEGARFHANDNIAAYIGDGELELLQAEVQHNLDRLLRSLVIDLDNDHNSKDTPKRVAKMFIRETFGGRYINPPAVTTFPNDQKLDEMYTVGPITVRSTCSHHLMPVTGECYIGVIPGDNVIGLSKFNRLVDWISTRPQIQEEATVQIADLLEKHLGTKDIAVVMNATHGCMTCRGVKDSNTRMATSVMRGKFRDDASARAEVLSLIKE